MREECCSLVKKYNGKWDIKCANCPHGWGKHGWAHPHQCIEVSHTEDKLCDCLAYNQDGEVGVSYYV